MAAPSEDGAALTTDQYVVDFINREFGDDLKSLSKLKEIYCHYKDRKHSIEQQLSLASTEVPTEIEAAIGNAEQARETVKKIDNDQEKLYHDIMDNIRTVQPMVDEFTRLSKQIQEIENYIKYLNVIGRMEEFSSQIQTCMITEEVDRAVSTFKEMTSLYTVVQSSHCHNLLTFIKDTVLFWYKLLKDKIAGEFEDILKTMRWPLIALSIKSPPVQDFAETNNIMDSLFKRLLQLQLPDGLTIDNQPSSPTLSCIPGFKQPLLPLQLMLKPFRKRFRYHFYGKKQTNSLDKPEWYLTQILTWIRDHADFLDTKIQPLLKAAGMDMVDAKTEIARGLVSLAMEKMVADLPDIMYDEHLFSHLVDEVLLFDRELKSSYAYPSSFPSCLHVLSDEKAFEKWVLIERKFAVEKMDAMLSSSTAWTSQYRDISDVDELKVPECGESFMTMMLTITDRYKLLPYPQHRLKFLDLQLELLDDFRIRLVQVMKEVTHDPLGTCFCSVLNTVYYVAEVLREWSELVFFLQLQYYKSKYSLAQRTSKEQMYFSTVERMPSCDESWLSFATADSSILSDDFDGFDLPAIDRTVFDELINLFDGMKLDMLKNINNYVFTDVQARSQRYRQDRWLCLPNQKELVALGMSPSACEMMLVLKDHLSTVEKLISKPLFVHFWQELADRLNKFILNEVILANHFNEGGALQIKFDMTRNMFPLFGEFTQKPENYFKEVKEAVLLLTLKVGSAIMLKEMLEAVYIHEKKKKQKSKESDPEDALNEIGVYRLSQDQALAVLSLRTNLKMKT